MKAVLPEKKSPMLCEFPADVQLVIQSYLKPTEILVIHGKRLLKENDETFTFWSKQALYSLGIPLDKFKSRNNLPFHERFLYFFDMAGGVDYGSLRYRDLGSCLRKSLKEGDVSLVQYFLEKIPCYRRLSYYHDLGRSAGQAPNFLQVLHLLVTKGLGPDEVEIAWLIHYLSSLCSDQYRKAVSLIRNRRKLLLDYAVFYAVEQKNVLLIRRLLDDFQFDRDAYVDDLDDEYLMVYIQALY